MVRAWGVYILQSIPTGHLYTGVTNDPDRRTQEHNRSPKGAKRTKAGRPWVLVYWKPCPSKSEALRTEYAIKKMARARKLRLFQE